MQWLPDLIRRPTLWLLVPAFLVVLPLSEQTVQILWREPKIDRVQLFEHRLAHLRDTLGGEEGVGFVTDGGEVGDLMRVQYVLTPLIISSGTVLRPSFVIVHTESSPGPHLAEELRGYVFQTNLGGGLALFRRESNQ